MKGILFAGPNFHKGNLMSNNNFYKFAGVEGARFTINDDNKVYVFSIADCKISYLFVKEITKDKSGQEKIYTCKSPPKIPEHVIDKAVQFVKDKISYKEKSLETRLHNESHVFCLYKGIEKELGFILHTTLRKYFDGGYGTILHKLISMKESSPIWTWYLKAMSEWIKKDENSKPTNSKYFASNFAEETRLIFQFFNTESLREYYYEEGLKFEDLTINLFSLFCIVFKEFSIADWECFVSFLGREKPKENLDKE